ncbi:efflux RND transporter periplasmic adaptor subunit [Candidatus Methylospira mobilis]|uniref:Efflux RND transporter periplasmic adaptor subunit n=1 Tax=Candidatus Methylospira mobilis TaxID=1808979 RepID=A0A5Q0BPZ4_9GAMM|nr:efflux RND transporter periplasmic adaptor subunit [Candidatus Methylospira mobilis]QFY44274.1 efflux RND transporter periplasmic adaptor subunit [Candidatus Methylospira mobilis]
MFRRRNASFIALTIPLSFVLAGCGHSIPSDEPRTQPPLVRTEIVKDVVSAERSFTGIVAARIQSDLGFRVPGKILERLVDTGQKVRRGQALMRIDPDDLKLAMQQLDEAVAAAKAHARQAANDEARYRDLVSEGAVSASEYDQIKAVADSAEAQLSAAKAQADIARNAVGYAVLVADADGIVVETLAEPGQVVAAGQVVARVAHAGQREAVIDLPETLRPQIGSIAQATAYGANSLSGSAKLRQLSDAANRLTRTFEARYVLDGNLANAPLGSTISIQIPDARPSARLQVPIASLFDPGAGPGVWVVDGNGAPHVTWRAVQLAALNDETASIAGGLKPGDRFVTLGAHLMYEGERVRLMENSTDKHGEQP